MCCLKSKCYHITELSIITSAARIHQLLCTPSIEFTLHRDERYPSLSPILLYVQYTLANINTMNIQGFPNNNKKKSINAETARKKM